MADEYGLQRAEELRKILDARVAEADRQERARMLGRAEDGQAAPTPEEETETPVFQEDGELDPAFVEVRRREYSRFGGHWVFTGRYFVTYRRRLPEDGTDPVVYQKPTLPLGPPAGTKIDAEEGRNGFRNRVYRNGPTGETAYRYIVRGSGPTPPAETPAPWLNRSGQFGGWSRDGG
jgi:hypothetical protein